jgi:HEPN domain-containing protein
MGFYADAWLHEARNRINIQPDQLTAIEDFTAEDLANLTEAVEKAIKAALIENYGSIPQKHDHKKLVVICQSTGIWDVLPPALKDLVQEIDSYDVGPGAEAVSSKFNAASVDKLQRYLSLTHRLIDYIEHHVIGNDSVLRRLRVS